MSSRLEGPSSVPGRNGRRIPSAALRTGSSAARLQRRNRSAQDDRLVGEWAGSRFLAALGMTERRARATARAGSRFLASTPTGKERLSGTPAALGMTERRAKTTAVLCRVRTVSGTYLAADDVWCGQAAGGVAGVDEEVAGLDEVGDLVGGVVGDQDYAIEGGDKIQRGGLHL